MFDKCAAGKKGKYGLKKGLNETPQFESSRV